MTGKATIFIFSLLTLALPQATTAKDTYQSERRKMVEIQIQGRGVRDKAVLDALNKVPRHLFVPKPIRAHAYADKPLPIGNRQTISQPYIVGLMTELLELEPEMKVLEIGTGSGYQAAVLAEIVKKVYTIEIIPELAQSAEKKLLEIGYKNIRVKAGDGYRGWPEHAPFDAIIVTAAPNHIPQPLIDQLKVGGKLVLPVGDFFQNLIVVKKSAQGIEKKNIIPVIFVPMTGEAQER